MTAISIQQTKYGREKKLSTPGGSVTESEHKLTKGSSDTTHHAAQDETDGNCFFWSICYATTGSKNISLEGQRHENQRKYYKTIWRAVLG